MTNTVKKKTSSRVGRRRWARLVQFLESTMSTGGSERVRVMAAMRLADVLTARDARAAKVEDREYRAALRAQGESVPEPVEAVEPESASEAAQRFLQSVGRGGAANE